MDVRPIGVYDSGVGGISLWRALRGSLPDESIVYLGDGANCPYGDKSAAQITEYAFSAVEELLKHDCKMVVIACNTATSTAIAELRSAYSDLPFVGMEPAIKPACLTTESGVVAVLATKRSLESDLFARTTAKYAVGVEVVKQVGEGFVELVEKGLENSDQAYEVVKPIVDMLAAKGVDKIVLGCTHYPFLMAHIERAIAGRKIDIVDPSTAIIKRIKTLLSDNDLEAPEGGERVDSFITFANEEYCKILENKAKDSVI